MSGSIKQRATAAVRLAELKEKHKTIERKLMRQALIESMKERVKVKKQRTHLLILISSTLFSGFNLSVPELQELKSLVEQDDQLKESAGLAVSVAKRLVADKGESDNV